MTDYYTEGFAAESGRRLSAAMQRSGLDNHELGERLDVSAHAVRMWRRGQQVPTALMLRRICYVLGVSADYMLDVDLARGEAS